MGLMKVDRPAGGLELFDPGRKRLWRDEIRHEARPGNRCTEFFGSTQIVHLMAESRDERIGRTHLLIMRKVDRNESKFRI